ncbi:hypothetical protein MNB_SV-14-1728 [hydrothermal vent metagenome]|uniref:Transposase IS200-like domain-containing protein n=1 Tax=hydrothermal vent metagenome TaxID=652676 RepID=A0A1W1CW05_9ZZZZ
MNNFYKRKQLRLGQYNYADSGLYFITICGQNRIKYFGEIVNKELKLNQAGNMIEYLWLDIPKRFDSIELREYIIMPNHFHAIVEISPRSTVSLGEVVGAFKSLTTNEYIKGVKKSNWLAFDKRLWQRNYYEHVIRDEVSHYFIAEYIQNNPLKWEEDKLYIS